MPDDIDVRNSYERGWKHGFITGAVLDVLIVGALIYALLIH